MAHSQISFQLFNTDTFTPGVTLFIGVGSSYQSLIANAICYDHLLDNGVLVQLVERGGENMARGQMQAWALAERYPLDKLRYRVASPERWSDSANVLNAISDAMTVSDVGKPLLVYRDLAQFTTPVLPRDHFFSVARDVEATLQAPLVIAGSYGSHPAMRPGDLQDACRSCRVIELKAGSSVNATMTDLRTGRRWTASGEYAAGTLLWRIEPVEQKEAA